MFYLFNHPGAKVSQQQFPIPSIFNMNRPVETIPKIPVQLPVNHKTGIIQIEKKKLIY
jgi:hypothetical protein